ncbi:MAG: hypothetical protein ACRET2_08980 [Steroidobacteraceae bacterium]
MSDGAPVEKLDINETVLAADAGMRLAEGFHEKNGRLLPCDQIEFAGMLGVAYALGRESIAGKVKP